MHMPIPYKVGELSSDHLSMQDDTVGFHDDDYQRLLYISGPTLRYEDGNVT